MWGVNCNQSCDCFNKGECDHVNGKCTCKPGYRGEKVGFYRLEKNIKKKKLFTIVIENLFVFFSSARIIAKKVFTEKIVHRSVRA